MGEGIGKNPYRSGHSQFCAFDFRRKKTLHYRQDDYILGVNFKIILALVLKTGVMASSINRP